MSNPHSPPPPPPPPPDHHHQPLSPQPQLSLYKQKSWSPDTYRDEAWLRRKGKSKARRKSRSVTEEDVDELKACIELGFGFDSPEVDRKLSDTLPALGLYYAVNKQYNDTVSKSTASDCDSPTSPYGSPLNIIGPGDNPQTVKTRLKQWAQVVACSVRQISC
ncbi:DUF1685 domain-containing protein [Cephalotus follicularis]|uniref:DUF1685 domain-containing protein n=1 Tax=Cephalotus follicularis TaxID=3775 RepID=A0A1Q3CQK4_CEPFO|nr:DUF1685 domain-containing protein [Cephalotus follicularis]